MSRRCSHCGHDGHNSRTCLDKGGAAAAATAAAAPGPGHGHGFKLFGVCVTAASDSAAPTSSPSLAASPSSTSSNNLSAMRKSFSMGNLSNYGNSDGASPPSASLQHEHPDLGDGVDGYASDDVVHTNSSSVRERKKGVPWTEEEHRSFLLGLKKLGKGDWRGISRNFVKTRTPTQVASHAQKYFLRRNNLNKRRRRSSLFDITSDTVSSLLEESVMEEPDFEQAEAEAYHELNLGKTIPYGSGPDIQASLLPMHNYPGVLPVPIPSLKLSIAATNIAQEGEYTSTVKETKKASTGLTVMETVPEGNDDSGNGLKMFSFPVPFVPFWPPSSESKILKPTPIMPACLSKTGGTKQIPELSLGNSRPVMEPSPLSYKLQEEGSRQSAFHSMSSSSRTDIDNQGRLGSAISVP